jgi:small subunit ribosomal protein S16
MSVSIRLRREGTKNRPYYKVVVADSRSPRDGKFIEIIGTYDPKVEGENSTLKIDRAEQWISRGAQPSDTVRSLLKKNRARNAAGPDEAGETPAAPKKTAKKSAPVKPAPEAPAPDEAAPAPAEVAAPSEAPAASGNE